MDPNTQELDAPPETAAESETPHTFLYAVTGQTPWWIVSVLLHGLVIVLAGLFTMSLGLDTDKEPLIVQTTVFKPEVAQPIEEKKPDPTKALSTDEPKIATTSEPVDAQMLVAEALKAIADISDHATTQNPDATEDTGSNGRPENHMRLTAEGSIDVEGGGGEYGREVAESMIGVAAAGAGKDGGWGGGEGGGIGMGKGFGKGEIGDFGKGRRLRIPRAPGITRGSESSVDAALSWLAYHQEADGSWNAKKYGASVKTDTAVTGFALLAFLGAGHTERVGNFRENVRKGIAWLKSKQDAEGMIWDTTDDNAHHRAKGYPCAIASLAMIEAGGMGNVPETRAAAQKAVDYMCNVHQMGEGYDKRGWRYAAKSEGDLSVTGWFIMALKSAKVCGFSVPEQSMEGAIKFLDSVEVKEQGGDAYSPSRYKYMVNNDHLQTAHRLTAIGTLARQFLGWKAEELRPSVDYFVNKGGVPAFGANGESVDLYYWYYASLACFQQHKVQPDLWKRWCDALKDVTVNNQCKEGDDRGSWNPVGAYSGEWGRVGQTALNALCLEVWYRYKLMDAGPAN